MHANMTDMYTQVHINTSKIHCLKYNYKNTTFDKPYY